MKKLIFVLFLLVSSFELYAQDTKPTNPEFKILQAPNNITFWYNPVDSSLWGYKGATGWVRIANWRDFAKFKLKKDSLNLSGYFTQFDALSKEDKSNKVVSISISSTDVQYPSAKLLYDKLALKEDKAIRIPVNDVDYIVTSTVNTIIAYTNITTRRVLTLPPATTMGQTVQVIDENGLITPINRVVIQRSGTDLLDGDTKDIEITPFTSVVFTSNGTGKWLIRNRYVRQSAGVVISPSYVDHGDGSITIGGSGLYNLFREPDGAGIIRTYEISDPTLTLTNGASNYIVANYNNGTPVIQSITDVTLINETTIIPIMTIYRGGTRLHLLPWRELGLAMLNKIHQSIVKTQRYRLQSGLGLGESTGRVVTLTEGIVWVGANSFNLPSFNSTTNSLFFLYHSGGVWQTPTVVTQYNNTQYDNGIGLQTLNPNKYAVNYIYRGVEIDDESYMVLGQGNYTLLQAQASLPPANLPAIITSHAILVGRIIVEQGAATAYEINSIFSAAFALSSTGSHNDLSGLQSLNGVAGQYYHLSLVQDSIATREATNSLAGYVGKGSQTFGGVKTFTLSPIVPTPTTDYQAATKLYADGKDPSSTNEIQTLTYTPSTRVMDISLSATDATLPLFSTTSTDAGLVNGGTGISAKFLRGDNTWQSTTVAEIDPKFALDSAYIKSHIRTDLDKSSTNELQTISTSGAAGNITLSNSGGTLNLNVNDADASITNEIQTISNINDATSHTATLSNSGGSIKLIEGTGVILTTSGTELNGIVTIANSGIITEVDGSITNEGSLSATDKTTYSKNIHSNTSLSTDVVLRVDSIAPVGLSISRLNNKITFKNEKPDQTVVLNGGGITAVTGTYPNFTITSTEIDPKYVLDSAYIKGHVRTDLDKLITNEGKLTVSTKSTYSQNINSNTSTSIPVVLKVDSLAPAILITSTANKISLKADTTYLMRKATVASLYIPKTQRGANNGVATLDAGGKVPFTQLPAALMIYKGLWTPSTNTPTLADGTGINGWVYKVTADGSANLGSGVVNYLAGDFVIHNGTIWERSVGTDNVVSVNGQQGVVTLTTANIAASTNKNYVTDAQQTNLHNPTSDNQTLTIAGTTSPTIALSGSNTATFSAGTGITLGQSTGTITVTNSAPNTNQTLANTSDATSHTATLSSSGGSLKLAEGTGIGLATTGTSGDGVATITNTAPNVTTNLSISGTSSPLTLNSSDGDDVTITAGTGISLTGTSGNMTITNTVTDTNTTYDHLAVTTTGGANLRLHGSDSSTDDVKFTSDGATTVSYVDASTIKISSTDNNSTNLSYTPSATNGIVVSDTGNDATVPLVTTVASTNLAGLMSPVDKTKLDGIATGATANTGTVTSVATGIGLSGGTITTSGTLIVDTIAIASRARMASEDAKRVPYTVLTDTKDPTGFLDGKNINISYDWTTRTITLTGTLDYYYNGVKKTLASPWTSQAHTATIGEWFLYSTNGTTFFWSQTPWSFENIMVSYVNYKATAATTVAMREPHGIMPWKVHEELHTTIGTYLTLGGKLTAGTYTENIGTDAAVTPSFDAATIKDEDSESLVSAWAQGTYTTMYVGAGSTSVFNLASALPFTAATAAYLEVNNVSTGTMTPAVTLRYYNVYQILLPTTSDASSLKYRTIMLQPQATYTSLALAQGEDVRSLRFGGLSTLTEEFIVYARITYLASATFTNTGKCAIATGGVSYVVGSRASLINVTGVAATSHAALSNLDWLSAGHIATPSTLGSLASFDAIGTASETQIGGLTETIQGLVLSDSTRQVIGGATSLGLRAGYVIPTTTNISHGESGYTGRISSLTTTGSSGSSTFSSNTLNIPTYTLSGLGGEPILTKGTYTESIDGIVLSDSTRQVIGGATVLGLKAGRVIPTATNISHGETAYTNRITSLTTTGSSGASTLSSNTLNVPNYTLAGLGGEPSQTKGVLTESVDGLVFSDSTRQVIGGATALSLKSGRVIPTSTNISHGESGYTGRIGTLTTTGSSGAATFSSNTLNIPTYTLAGLGGLASEVDGDITNEGKLTATDKTTYSKNIHSNTSTSVDVVLRVDSISNGLSISRSGNKITLANTGIITEVDGSVTNESQALTVTGTTTPIITLASAGGVGGGSATLTSGTGIGLSNIGGNITITNNSPNIVDGDGVTGNEYNTSMGWNNTTNKVSVVDGGGTKDIEITGFLESEVDPKFALDSSYIKSHIRTDADKLATNEGQLTTVGTTNNATIHSNTSGSTDLNVKGAGTSTVTSSGANITVTSNDQYTGTVTAVSGTAPIVSSGGTAPAISISAATTIAAGSMSSADKTKLDGIATGATANTGTVTSVAALTLGTTGTDLSSTVATGTTTPVITLQVPTASATNRGALSAANWSTFNSKQNALTNNLWLPSTDFAGNASNVIRYSADNTIQFGAPVEISSLYHVANAGFHDIVNIPVTSESASGTVHGVGITVDDTRILEASGISDGAGGLSSSKIIVNGKVGIGTNTPLTSLHLQNPYGIDQRTAGGNYSSAIRITNPYYDHYGSGGELQFGNKLNNDGVDVYSVIKGTYDIYGATSVGGGLHFYTRAANESLLERLTIKYNGNVGIGTTAPATVLEVKGVGNGYGENIRITSSNVYGGVGMWKSTTNIGILGFGSAGNLFTNGLTDAVNLVATNALQLGNGSTANLTILNNGNVGIGTTAPSQLLEIAKSHNTMTNIIINNTDTTTSDYNTQAGLQLNVAGVIVGYLKTTAKLLTTSATVPSLYLTTYGAGDIYYGFNNYLPTHAMLANGNVGIGTTAPTTTLDVNGVIRSLAYPAPTGGIGLELGYNSTYGQINSYSRTGGIYTQLRLDGLTTIINSGSGGNVGIGTTSPNDVLEIRTAANNGLRLSAPNSYVANAGSRMEFWNYTTQELASIQGSFQNVSNGNYGRLDFGTRTTDVLGVETKMSILANGNVGIGTTAPAEGKLVVYGTGYNSIFSDGTNKVGVYLGNTGLFTGALITTYTNVPLGFSTNQGAGAMVISTNGNVGIGLTSPTAKLHLAAGSATANTAPLKFTSGALLTAPEAGAVEFLTDAWYGTITTGAARKEFAFKDYVDSKVTDVVSDGVVNIAPSQNAVYDALQALPRYNTSASYNAVTKIFSITDGGGTVSDTIYSPPVVQDFGTTGNTTVSWAANAGLDAKITLSGNTTITLSGLVAGTSGNLVVTNPSGTAKTLQFAGYSNRIARVVWSSSNYVLTSGNSKVDVFSWYYNGSLLIWNGGLDYK